MKRFLMAIQVVAVLGLLGFLFYYFFYKTPPPLDHNPASWNTWDGFYAISYPGVTKDETSNYISRELLGDQMKALREAGFHSIAPEDIAAFLQGQRPLPFKGLLLLFEGGRKDSYLFATPLLEKNGLLATMAVPTAFVQSWDNFYLKKSDLIKMAQSPYWRLGSMGHQASKLIPTDRQGTQGHYLTSRLFSDRGPEDDVRFRERITRDYTEAAGMLNQVTGKPAPLYLYPFADAGLGPQADPLAAAVNRTALASSHSLAFSSADNPFNSPGSDPLRLTRLRVPSFWTGKKLVEELEKFAPRITPLSDLGDPGIWLAKVPVKIKDHAVTIPPGTDLWVRGSEGWRDLDTDFRLSLNSGGSLVFFLRYGGPQAYLRLTLSSEGLLFQERTGRQLQTLARIPTAPGAGPVHRIRIRLKANRAWLWHNEVIHPGPIPLSGTVIQGKTGLSGQRADILLLEFKTRLLPGYYVFSDRYQILPKDLRPEIKAILPNWDEKDFSDFLNEERRRDMLIAASEGVQTIPVIRIPGDLSDQERKNAALKLLTLLDQPLVKTFIKTLALTGTDRGLIEVFQRRGFRIVELLNPQQAARLISAKQKVQGDYLLMDGPEKEAREALNKLLYLIPAHKMIVSLDAAGPGPSGVAVAFHFNNLPGGN